MKDLHILPKVKDSWSYLYVEHAKIDQDAKSIAVHDAKGAIQVTLRGPVSPDARPWHFGHPCSRKDPRRQRMHADVVRRGERAGVRRRPR